MGVDAIAPTVLVALPAAGMEELVQIYHGVEQALALPLSTLSQWMVALQKPDGGERLIVLQAMTNKVLFSCSQGRLGGLELVQSRFLGQRGERLQPLASGSCSLLPL